MGDRQVLAFKSDSIEYVVYELDRKKDSENNQQCYNFVEINNKRDGFEIYGANIADLFSFFFNVDKHNIYFEDKKRSFYSVIYKGKVESEIKKDIFQKLIDYKGLKIVKNTILADINSLEIEKSIKLSSYINPNSNEKISILLNDEKYIFSNVNLIIFVKKLNELYPGKFFYEGDSTKRYNLEIPVGLGYGEIIFYLKDKYDISINNIQREVLMYSLIENK
ncbi:MAG: hypothetical protein PHR19_04390 [Bacteroidales bacterium]|jgi:hypothetical protein|nr:hypothetical protein [Bacteroidales bacterium]HHT51739.1 hypothetical protein [Bacteroidales bacterium]